MVIAAEVSESYAALGSGFRQFGRLTSASYRAHQLHPRAAVGALHSLTRNQVSSVTNWHRATPAWAYGTPSGSLTPARHQPPWPAFQPVFQPPQLLQRHHQQRVRIAVAGPHQPRVHTGGVEASEQHRVGHQGKHATDMGALRICVN